MRRSSRRGRRSAAAHDPVLGRPAGGLVDDGSRRPLPRHILRWSCPSIQAGPFVPGEPFELTVDVVNHGRGGAIAVATVVVYWADPAVGFDDLSFLGAATVAVEPAGGRATTGVITALIPASAPENVALLAKVSHPRDPAGAAADPDADRHWAQRNVHGIADARPPAAFGRASRSTSSPLAEDLALERECRGQADRVHGWADVASGDSGPPIAHEPLVETKQLVPLDSTTLLVRAGKWVSGLF